MVNYNANGPSSWGMQNAQQNNWNGVGFQSNQHPRSLIPGRAIRQLSEINPNDVPQEGTPAFFPIINDQGYIETIVTKYWDNANILIRTDTYRLVSSEAPPPVEENRQPSPPQDPFEKIFARLDAIEEKMTRKESNAAERISNYYGSEKNREE